MNELSVQDFGVTYFPGTIVINNYDELLERVEAATEKYKNYVVTEDSLKADKKLRAELRKLVKDINDKKISAKRDFLEPLNDFEKQAKGLMAVVQDVIEPIDESIKHFDDEQKKLRIERALDIISESAPNYGINPKDVPFVDKWANKISKTELTKLITADLKQMQKDNQLLEAYKKAVDQKAKELNENPEAWYPYITTETDINDLLKDVEEAAKKRLERETRERELEQAQEVASSSNESSIRVIDTDTGEVIEPIKHTKQQITFTVQGNQDEIDELARYIQSTGLKVVNATDRRAV